MSDFDAFFRENYSLVVGVAERRLNSLADAEEIAAAAFRVAWQHASAGEEITVPWLYGVVRNLVGNEYRRRTRQAALVDKIETTVQVDADPDDGDPGNLREVVASLPTKHREVIEMAYWDDLSAPEIAEVLGLSPGAVHARLSRAREALRQALAAAGGERG